MFRTSRMIRSASVMVLVAGVLMTAGCSRKGVRYPLLEPGQRMDDYVANMAPSFGEPFEIIPEGQGMLASQSFPPFGPKREMRSGRYFIKGAHRSAIVDVTARKKGDRWQVKKVNVDHVEYTPRHRPEEIDTGHKWLLGEP